MMMWLSIPVSQGRSRSQSIDTENQKLQVECSSTAAPRPGQPLDLDRARELRDGVAPSPARSPAPNMQWR